MKKLTILFAFLPVLSSCTKEMPCPQAPSSDPAYYSGDNGGDNSDDSSGDDGSDSSGDDSGDDGNSYHVHQHTFRPGTTITSYPAANRGN